MDALCFFLVYRIPKDGPVNLGNPTGGMVMEAEKVVDGFPVSDHALAESVAKERWHIGPHEYIVLMETFEPKEKCLAASLHAEYERDMLDWMEWMEGTGSAT